MSSVPTEDSNIFSFSVSQWWPGTMTMGPPRLKWLFMRSSPESNRGFSQWIMKWWVPHFKSMIHSILHLFGRSSFLMVMDPICRASRWGLPQRSAHLGPVLHHDSVTNHQKARSLISSGWGKYVEHLIGDTKIETKFQANKFFFISLQISLCDFCLLYFHCILICR